MMWLKHSLPGYFLHTITKGQSLYSIASMYNVTTGDIVKMNPRQRPEKLKPVKH